MRIAPGPLQQASLSR